jgi:hypothetical protein
MIGVDELDGVTHRFVNPRSLQVWGQGTLHAAPGLQIRRNVIDPSDGALYTGGSSWVPGMPMVASSAGLAGHLQGQATLDAGCTFVPLEYLAAFCTTGYETSGAGLGTQLPLQRKKQKTGIRRIKKNPRVPAKPRRVLAGW